MAAFRPAQSPMSMRLSDLEAKPTGLVEGNEGRGGFYFLGNGSHVSLDRLAAGQVAESDLADGQVPRSGVRLIFGVDGFSRSVGCGLGRAGR